MSKLIPANFYDLNVWSDEATELTLTAYEWEATPDGKDLQMNSSVYHSKTFTTQAEIEFLLDDLYLNHYPLTDYDNWVNFDEIYSNKTPAGIKQFLESLPEYQLPAIALFEGAN
jgi:hypothetical protein